VRSETLVPTPHPTLGTPSHAPSYLGAYGASLSTTFQSKTLKNALAWSEICCAGTVVSLVFHFVQLVCVRFEGETNFLPRISWANSILVRSTSYDLIDLLLKVKLTFFY